MRFITEFSKETLDKLEYYLRAFQKKYNLIHGRTKGDIDELS